MIGQPSRGNYQAIYTKIYILNLMATDSSIQVEEIPNTRLLCFIYHVSSISAKLKIFDISRGKAKEVFSMEQIKGGEFSLNFLQESLTCSFISFHFMRSNRVITK